MKKPSRGLAHKGLRRLVQYQEFDPLCRDAEGCSTMHCGTSNVQHAVTKGPPTRPVQAAATPPSNRAAGLAWKVWQPPPPPEVSNWAAITPTPPEMLETLAGNLRRGGVHRGGSQRGRKDRRCCRSTTSLMRVERKINGQALDRPRRLTWCTPMPSNSTSGRLSRRWRSHSDDGPAFAAALKTFRDRLPIYPQFGDPLYDLTAEKGQIYTGVIPPITMRYGVFEDRRLVFCGALPILMPMTRSDT